MNNLSRDETPGYSLVWVEVLAGAISWGFKSPSPHHILKGLLVFELDPIYLARPNFGPYVAPDRWLVQRSGQANKGLRLAWNVPQHPKPALELA